MAFLQSLYSGSSGNCTLVRGSEGALLIDMGKSCRATLKALYEQGVSASELCGIFVTHEHSDHVGGLMTYLKNYPTPVFGPHATLTFLKNNTLVPQNASLHPLEPGEAVSICGISIHPFRTSHDSVDCYGYRLRGETGCVAVATDLGKMTPEILDELSGCRFVALESNYDEGKLRSGPYPLYLQRRILSEHGHLSNLDCAETAVRLAQSGTEFLELRHLSAENNTPAIAETTCLGLLENYGCCGMQVCAAPRLTAGRRFEF